MEVIFLCKTQAKNISVIGAAPEERGIVEIWAWKNTNFQNFRESLTESRGQPLGVTKALSAEKKTRNRWSHSRVWHGLLIPWGYFDLVLVDHCAPRGPLVPQTLTCIVGHIDKMVLCIWQPCSKFDISPRFNRFKMSHLNLIFYYL